MKLRLKEIMQAKEIKSIDVADDLKVSPNTIYNWRMGIHQPDFDDLEKLCHALDCPIEELLVLDCQPPKKTVVAAINNCGNCRFFDVTATTCELWTANRQPYDTCKCHQPRAREKSHV